MNRSFSPQELSPLVGGQLRTTLFVLDRADYYAEHLGQSVKDFAISFDDLAKYGTTENEIIRLVSQGAVRRLPLAPGSSVASELTPDSIRKSEFVLSERGRVLVDLAKKARAQFAVPYWCCERRELYAGELLIKAYRVPSPNQRTILDVFEEEKWPHRIDDPLPPKTGVKIKRRLIETIKSLNRAHRINCLRFFGDGTGRGICWRWLA